MAAETILEVLGRHDISQAELARRIGMNPVTLWRKLAGNRPLFQADIDAILVELRKHDSRLSYERVFGRPERIAASGGK
jgi:transcriptional regulator with XRE-family HTH domain